MCKNATKTAATLMAAIEPTLKNLLSITGILSTEEGQTAIKAFDAALLAVQEWHSGTAPQDVIQLINAFDQVFNVLPVPAEYKALANIIAAGITTVIGVLIANSPAPEPPAGVMPHENMQALHQISTAAETAEKVQKLVPGFKRSIFHSPESQYDHAWNKTVAAHGLPESLKV